jgi:hypothetical protein
MAIIELKIAASLFNGGVFGESAFGEIVTDSHFEWQLRKKNC